MTEPPAPDDFDVGEMLERLLRNAQRTYDVLLLDALAGKNGAATDVQLKQRAHERHLPPLVSTPDPDHHQ